MSGGDSISLKRDTQSLWRIKAMQEIRSLDNGRNLINVSKVWCQWDSCGVLQAGCSTSSPCWWGNIHCLLFVKFYLFFFENSCSVEKTSIFVWKLEIIFLTCNKFCNMSETYFWANGDHSSSSKIFYIICLRLQVRYHSFLFSLKTGSNLALHSTNFSLTVAIK